MSSIKLKSVPIEKLIDKHIGKRGASRREMFETALKKELSGKANNTVNKQSSQNTASQ